jgi:TRAP-type C4-dicarboxylate transport system permease small subunit
MEKKRARKLPDAASGAAQLESVPPEDGADAERQARKAFPRFFRLLDDALRTVMVLLLVALIITVSVNVVGRFAFNRSLATSDELSRFLFIWVIFLGAALAHLHREHIAVDIVVRRLPAFLVRPITVLQELLIGLVLVALLISAWRVMELSLGTSPLLRVPLSWVNASVPLAAVVMLLVTVYRIAAVFRPARPDEEG